MESDWQRRGHPLHETSVSSALPTLPSVAELLASSRPTSDSIPAYHHPPASSQRLVSRSTPPNAPALSTSANASSSTEHSYFAATSHASQASPTESATSTSPSEPQTYQQVAAHQSSAASFTPASTSGACHGVDVARPQPPMNARRQDSAIAHQRVETSKEASSFVPSLDSNLLYSHRSPNDNYRPTSPASTSHPISHTSLPSMQHPASVVSGSHENVESQPGTELAPRSAGPCLPPDQSNTTNPRQQRYNVRFATTHTPANMPSAQRARQSPPLPTPPAQPEVAQSPPRTPEEMVALSDEPAIQAIHRSLRRSEEQQQFEPRNTELTVERCLGCNETWSRPLFTPSTLESNSSPHSTNEMDKATSGFRNIVEQLQQHGKDADAKYAQWIAHHGKCPRNGKSPSPLPQTSIQPTHARASNALYHGDGQTTTNSNKRKSEALQPDTQKLRKVTFDAESPSAQLIRSSAST